MVVKKIIIWCSPGTGSSLLSGTLNKCGMNFGNENTFYKGGTNSEHQVINSLHSEICTGTRPTVPDWLVKSHNEIPGGSAEEKYRWILRSYLAQAAEKGWACFGIKTTTGHNPSNFFGLLQLQREEWGDDIQYLTTVRHPLGALARLRKKDLPDAKDSQNIYNNWISHLTGRLALMQRGAIVVRYPEHFQNGKIKETVRKLGLQWDQEAANLYNEKQVTKYDATEATQLFADNPNLAEAYRLLIGAADA